MDKSKQPLVSIVIPTFNGLLYLEQAIKSVLDQDYPSIELIVLDDGSTDKTSEFLKKYQGVFYFESHQNMGQAETLNKGWRMSKGEILGYLSADDMLVPDAVSIFVEEFLKDPRIVLVYADNILINAHSKAIRNKKFPELDIYEMANNLHSHIGAGSFFLKNAFEKIGGWNKNYSYIGDYEYQLRLIELGKFKHINKFLAYYRVHLGSASYAPNTGLQANEYQNVIKELLARTEDEKLLSMKPKLWSKAYLFSARAHWRSSRFKESMECFWLSLKVYPRSLFSQQTYITLMKTLIGRQAYRLVSLLKGGFLLNKDAF